MFLFLGSVSGLTHVDQITDIKYTGSRLYLRSDQGDNAPCDTTDYTPGYYHIACMDDNRKYTFTSVPAIDTLSCDTLDVKYCKISTVDIYGADGMFRTTCRLSDDEESCVPRENQFVPSMPWYHTGTRYIIRQQSGLNPYKCDPDIDTGDLTHLLCDEANTCNKDGSVDCGGGCSKTCLAAKCEDINIDLCQEDFLIFDFNGNVEHLCTKSGTDCVDKAIFFEDAAINKIPVEALHYRSADSFLIQQAPTLSVLTCADIPDPVDSYANIACNNETPQDTYDCTDDSEKVRCLVEDCDTIATEYTGSVDVYDMNGRYAFGCGKGDKQDGSGDVRYQYIKLAEKYATDANISGKFVYRNMISPEKSWILCSELTSYTTIGDAKYALCEGVSNGIGDTTGFDCADDPNSCAANHCGYLDPTYCEDTVTIFDWDWEAAPDAIQDPSVLDVCVKYTHPTGGEMCISISDYSSIEKPDSAVYNRFMMYNDINTVAILCDGNDEWGPTQCEGKDAGYIYECIGLSGDCIVEDCYTLPESFCNSDIMSIDPDTKEASLKMSCVHNSNAGNCQPLSGGPTDEPTDGPTSDSISVALNIAVMIAITAIII